MSGNTNVISQPATSDRRAIRRAATQAEIVDAAWDLVREQGLAGLSMRDLGDRVGMRAQSVYSYFASKDEIYDAMFRQACQQHLDWIERVSDSDLVDTATYMRVMAHGWFAFCTADPVRYQLLFQRTIPGFEPSAASYALAVDVLNRTREHLAAVGVRDPESVDLAVAVLTGLTSQQLSNEPGGHRWERLIDRAVTMLLREIAPAAPSPKPRATGPESRRTR